MTIDLKDRLYTSSEVAEILGVSLRSVYRYLEEGKLDADIKTATGRHRFSRKNILDFLQPGGITKEQAEEQFFSGLREDEDAMDVLDLPALNKSSSKNGNLDISEKDDDFSFDLDEDFFKSLDFNSNDSKNNLESANSPKVKDGEYVDDDLEKLLREFEEKELENLNFSSSNQRSTEDEGDDFLKLDNLSNNKKEPIDEKLTNNDKTFFDDELDDFFKELESSFSEEKDSKIPDEQPRENLTSKKNEGRKVDSFDDSDFDFLDDLFDELDLKDSKSHTPADTKPNIEEETKDKSNLVDEENEDEEDNWLERFRKAAQKNSPAEEKVSKSSLDSNFFDRSKSNLDNFFDEGSKTVSSSLTDSITSFSSSSINSKTEQRIQTGVKEYYYTSSLNGLKEVAQSIDRVARKFDTDYAFTLNAGLSLHKPISPFSLIHVYVRSRDLELFEDYLNLSPADSVSEASVCILVSEDPNVFEDSYELHGLYVVSNVQLRSDLIDRGLDKLAREI